MTAYRSTTYIPPLVEQALKLAEQIDFTASSSIEVGRLLYVLTGHIQEGLIGEIGTGCGVGAAWIASALAPTASFVTIELDEQRSEIVRKLFEPVPNVRVMTGDWHTLLNEGSFAMLFADGGKAKQHEPETLLQALRPGGIIVLDDLTPLCLWTPEQCDQPDLVREFWLNDKRLFATEVMVNQTSAVIVATRNN